MASSALALLESSAASGLHFGACKHAREIRVRNGSGKRLFSVGFGYGRVQKNSRAAVVCDAGTASAETDPVDTRAERGSSSRMQRSYPSRRRTMYKSTNGRATAATASGKAVAQMEKQPAVARMEKPAVFTEIEQLRMKVDMEVPVKTGLGVQQEKRKLNWSEVSPDLILGDGPQCSEDVHTIRDSGARAVISMMIDDEHERLGIDWPAIVQTATALEMVAAKISMDEHFYHDQALALPEAVRTVASLTASGHKVYLSDASGLQRDSLVALSYLTFAKAMELRKAMQQIHDVCPSATPNMAAWEETKNKLLAGESTRLATLAQDLCRGREFRGVTGSSAEDWLTAQRLLISEHFQQGVSSHLQLTDKLSQVSYLKARKATANEMERVKMLAAGKAKEAAHAKEEAAIAKQQVLLLSARIKELMSDTEMVKGSLIELTNDNKELSRRVSGLLAAKAAAENSQQEAVSAYKEKLENAEARAALAIEKASTAEKEIATLSERIKFLQLRDVNASEAAAALSGTFAKLTEKLSELAIREQQSSVLAEAASEEAKVRLEEVLKEVTESRKREAAARSENSSAQESVLALRSTVDDLVQKVIAQKEATLESEGARALAQEQVVLLTKELEHLKNGESPASSSRIPELEKELMNMRLQLVSAAEKIGGLEEEKVSFQTTLTNLREEADRAATEHLLELAEATEQHRQEFVTATAYYQTELAEVAAELSAATSRGEDLADELHGARQYVAHLAEELERLRIASEQEAERREQQLHEELAFLKDSQAHVDAMTSEKINFEQQKVLLQRAVLVSIGLAIAGPVIVLGLFSSTPDISKVPAPDASVEQTAIFSEGLGRDTEKPGKSGKRSGEELVWNALFGKQNRSDVRRTLDRELAALNADLMKVQQYSFSPRSSPFERARLAVDSEESSDRS